MRSIPVVGAVVLLALAGCQSAQDADGPLAPGTARVETALTGTPGQGSAGKGVEHLREVIVTVAQVTAHSTVAGWVTLSDREVTVDLLKLGTYVEPLGLRTLPAGKVTQVRVILKAEGPHSVLTRDGQRIRLATPSGIQSGVKLKGLFTLDACHLATLPITFDGKKSIWVHPTGQGDEWILRPVIRLGRIDTTQVGCTPPPIPGDPTVPGSDPLPTNPTISTTERPVPLQETPGDPGPPGPGRLCSTGLSCLSGTCVDGACQPSGAGAPCNGGGDCASGTCLGDATCGDGPALPSGGACLADAQCLSNACVGGRCTPGSTGSRCQSVADCVAGTECTAGTCEPMLN